MKRRTWLLPLLALLLLFTACKKNDGPKGDTQGTETSQPDGSKTESGGKTETTENPAQEAVAEREKLEAERREKYGKMYVPLPALGEEREKKNVTAKGIFLTAEAAAQSFSQETVDAYAQAVENGTWDSVEANSLERILGMLKATEMNTLVIDVKNDSGFVTHDSNIELVKELDATYSVTHDGFRDLMQYARDNDIYMIARVVCFKDEYFADKNPDHAIQLAEGGVYRDGAGTAWVNPFDRYVQDYVIAIAKEAVLLGFDEVQFDYVRFPDGAATYNPITVFPGREDRDKDEAIRDFLAYAREELAPYNANVSADVFGIITHTWDDSPEDIGQTWTLIAPEVDAISPMIYPSHYSTGWYGYDVPDQHPYGVLYQSMQEAIERNAAVKNPGKIRPWIQGFTASWVDGYLDYGPQQISDQIVACRDLGIEEYLIWAVTNKYDPRIVQYEDRINQVPRSENQDLLDNTPTDALERFLRAQYNESYIVQFLMSPQSVTGTDYEAYSAQLETAGVELMSYEVGEATAAADGFIVKANATYEGPEGIAELVGGDYTLTREGGVWKVTPPTLTFQPKPEEEPETDAEEAPAEDGEEEPEDEE